MHTIFLGNHPKAIEYQEQSLARSPVKSKTDEAKDIAGDLGNPATILSAIPKSDEISKNNV
jgi:hypothetical protein